MVVTAQRLANGQQRAVAYLQTRDAAAGTQTRTYLDGHRVTVGPDFVTRSGPRQYTVTTHRDGLRDVSLPDGRPLFRERFGTYAWREGHPERVIYRDVSALIVAGQVIALGVPIVQIYAIVPYSGVVIYPYVPFAFVPAFYTPFLVPFATPLVIVPGCPFCPPPVVAFAEPVTTYADPVDLVGDLVLADAVQDGDAGVVSTEPPPAPDPAVAQLADEVDALQQQIKTAAAANDALQAQLADQQAQLDSLHQLSAPPQPAPPPTPSSPSPSPSPSSASPPSPAAPMSIPEPVRQQVHQQVREDIALHQQQQLLSLVDVIASADAQNYVFQIGDLIDTTEADSGEACTLITGDLVKFDQVPADGDAAARMRVVTSRSGSCSSNTVVQVSLTDLQEMLNAFSQRLEDSMKKVHDQVAAAAPGPHAD